MVFLVRSGLFFARRSLFFTFLYNIIIRIPVALVAVFPQDFTFLEIDRTAILGYCMGRYLSLERADDIVFQINPRHIPLLPPKQATIGAIKF